MHVAFYGLHLNITLRLSVDIKFDYRFLNLEALISHLRSYHQIQVATERLEFANLELFHQWKAAAEKKTNSMYVQKCACQQSLTTNRWYYYCNRAGVYTPRGTGERHLKSQGSCKVGIQCTAHIKAHQDKTSGVVIVNYCPFHSSHPIKLAHIIMDDSTRTSIAIKLKDGVSMEKILDDIRDTVTDHVSRVHLVTRQDLYNIKRQYNIEGIARHSNDHVSTSIWVEEMKALDYDPILLYKPQGNPSDLFAVCSDDFILCIQTKFQKDCFTKFAKNVICVDATHCTTQYDFKLVTILVMDEFGEGIPAAWMVSNREDTNTLKHFFEALKIKVGDVKVEVFMSDDASQYYNAWVSVFNGHPKKLLCRWHVDRAWRGALNSMIQLQEKRANVYHHMCVVMENTSIHTFTAQMQMFVSWLLEDPDLVSFCQYLQANYCNRPEQWAPCYRVGTPVNTNMAIEAFHRTLKVVYLSHKQNRRVDSLLSILLRIARDKVYERLIKLEKGKSSYRVSEINKRHESAEGIHCIPQNQAENMWTVQSEKMTYSIQINTNKCTCKMRCAFCSACVHMYTCSCMDCAIHFTVCKHSHFLHMFLMKSSHSSGGAEAVTTSTRCIPLSDNLASVQTDKQALVSYTSTDNICSETNFDDIDQYIVSTAESDLCSIKKDILDEIQTLQMACSDCNSIAALQAGWRHIKAALITIKTVGIDANVSTELPQKRHIAPNSNSPKQVRFYSTTQKRCKMQNPIYKPTGNELERFREELSSTVIKVCGVCFKEDDKDISDTIDWVKCFNCDIWMHSSCVETNKHQCP